MGLSPHNWRQQTDGIMIRLIPFFLVLAVALAAEARNIHVSYDLDEVNQERFASRGLIGGLQHLPKEISYGGRHSIVKRAPLVPFPFPLAKFKKPLKIPLKIPPYIATLALAVCVAGACAG